jgi:hypothetical protein
MVLEVFIDDRYRHRGSSCVSINVQLSRLILYKQAYQILETHYGQELDFLQVLLDDDRPNFFWLKPCDSEAPGSRKMDRTSKSTRTLSVRSLLKKMKITSKETIRFGLAWDEKADAGRIDISQPEEKNEIKKGR